MANANDWTRSSQTKLTLALGLLVISGVLLAVYSARWHRAAQGHVRWLDTFVTHQLQADEAVLMASQLSDTDDPEIRARIHSLVDELSKATAEVESGTHRPAAPAISAARVWRDELAPALTQVLAAESAPARDLAAQGAYPALVAFRAKLGEATTMHRTRAEEATARATAWTMLAALVEAGGALVLLILGWRFVTRVGRAAHDAARSCAKDSTAHRGERSAWSVAGLLDEMTVALRTSLSATAEERQRCQAILDAVTEGMVTIDDAGAVVSLNFQAELMFGYGSQELIGKNFTMLVPAFEEDPGHGSSAAYVRAEGVSHSRTDRCVDAVRRNGSRFAAELRVAEVREGGRAVFLASVRNIEDLQQAVRGERAARAAIGEAVERLDVAGRKMQAVIERQGGLAREQAAAAAEAVATVGLLTRGIEQAGHRANTIVQELQRAHDREGPRPGLQPNVATAIASGTSSDSSLQLLAEQTRAMADVLATMDDVGDQSEIVAVNAAIEASRAGPHGSGFARVTDELKALVAEAKGAAAQVRRVLAEADQARIVAAREIAAGHGHLHQGVAEMVGSDGDQLADRLNEAARSAGLIVAAAAEQSGGVSQIDRAMGQIAAAANEAVNATRELETAANDLGDLGRTLQHLLDAA